MKRLLLPVALIAFAVICLSIVHIDNVNKLDAESNELRKKLDTDVTSERPIDTSTDIPKTK